MKVLKWLTFGIVFTAELAMQWIMVVAMLGIAVVGCIAIGYLVTY